MQRILTQFRVSRSPVYTFYAVSYGSGRLFCIRGLCQDLVIPVNTIPVLPVFGGFAGDSGIREIHEKPM